ncbi:cytochrome P450 [Thermogemmatispora sp.]|uniref:cytochrome P450 n=1 Tax=Thermogemmatispora sp. TaxID=1968838 RepID=UPI00262F1E9C|nr:cytochrome P450 [Thermogemmatispora sp.]
MQSQPGLRATAPMLFGLQPLEDTERSFAWFDAMREAHPVFFHEGTGIWQVFRYDDVLNVLNDYTRFSSNAFEDVGAFFEGTLVAKDPPEHRKLRSLVNQAFTPRAVARLADRITQITQELLDAVLAKGELDVVADIAFPLPAKVIAELLGVPDQDWDIFQRWARADPSSPPARRFAGRTMRQEMEDYFTDLIAERRKSPREDLISALCQAEVDGQRLSLSELLSFCVLLLAAGQETTKNLIANAIVCFTDYPDVMERLRRQPELMPAAIEEVLRFLPPVWFLLRRTTTEVELGGQRIPPQQSVLVWTASANRDPAQFPEPDRFLIERSPNRHLAFGHGIHYCVGAPLARLEAKIALPLMLERLGHLERIPGIPIMVNRGLVFVIRSLPIAFEQASAARRS